MPVDNAMALAATAKPFALNNFANANVQIISANFPSSLTTARLPMIGTPEATATLPILTIPK